MSTVIVGVLKHVFGIDKGLEQNYQQIPGIAAATILGDGRIALIVDTDQMIPQGPAVTEQSDAGARHGDLTNA